MGIASGARDLTLAPTETKQETPPGQQEQRLCGRRWKVKNANSNAGNCSKDLAFPQRLCGSALPGSGHTERRPKETGEAPGMFK